MRIMIGAAGIFFNIVYAFMKLRPSGNGVVFVSRQSDEPSLDYDALARAIEAKGVAVEMHLHRQEKDSARFMSGAGANLRAILRQMRALAGARAAVTDGYSIPVSILKHRKGLTVFQVWHAIGAVKKFGLQTVPCMGAREAARARAMKMHEGYDYFAAPSEAAARFFGGAFGMGADRALVTGTPYLDALADGRFDSDDARGRIAALYPELAENGPTDSPARVVLYAPTYRPRAEAGDGVRRRRAEEELCELLRGRGYIVIERRHPVDEVGDGSGHAGGVAGRGVSTEELMYAADMVVTDYSSLAITAALIGKPLYYYIYDIEDYRRSPGLNIDPEEEYGRYASRDAEGVASLMEGGYDAEYMRDFASKYVETFDGECTERLSEAILQLSGIV
jgi:CDP-ribitol ribitolphosphotransferase